MGAIGVVEKGELLYRRSLGRSEATAFGSTMFLADNLWKFITRVVMLLCSFYREGIDIAMIAWPVCDPQRNSPVTHTVTYARSCLSEELKVQLDVDYTWFEAQ